MSSLTFVLVLYAMDVWTFTLACDAYSDAVTLMTAHARWLVVVVLLLLLLLAAAFFCGFHKP